MSGIAASNSGRPDGVGFFVWRQAPAPTPSFVLPKKGTKSTGRPQFNTIPPGIRRDGKDLDNNGMF